MAPARVDTVRGRIVVVQEDRFRLLTSSGQGLLLTLARNASTPQSALCRFHEHDVPVIVDYQGEPNLVTGIALSVRPAE